MRAHPLVRTVTLKNRAEKSKAHPKILERLEHRIQYEARMVNQKLGGDALNIFNEICKGRKP